MSFKRIHAYGAALWVSLRSKRGAQPLGGWEDAKRPGGIEKGGFPPSGAGSAKARKSALYKIPSIVVIQ